MNSSSVCHYAYTNIHEKSGTHLWCLLDLKRLANHWLRSQSLCSDSLQSWVINLMATHTCSGELVKTRSEVFSWWPERMLSAHSTNFRRKKTAPLQHSDYPANSILKCFCPIRQEADDVSSHNEEQERRERFTCGNLLWICWDESATRK